MTRNIETTEIFGTWTATDGSTITVEWNKDLKLTVRKDGKLAAFGCSVEFAQATVNKLAGQNVWVA